jgi:hypothetical protein
VAPRFRPDRWDVVFFAVAIGALLYLLYLGRDLTFWHDDWRFIDQVVDGWSIDTFLSPHNGHLVAFVALVWKPLLATVGTSSYTPYLAFVAVSHIASMAAIYWGVRRLTGPGAALAAAVLLLAAGGAGSALFHAFAVNLVLGTAFGLWAFMIVIAARRPHPIVVGLLLLAAVATSGNGLVFVVAVGVFYLFSPGRWRELWSLAIPLLPYILWYATWGRESAPDGFRFGLAGLREISEIVLSGLERATSAMVGLQGDLGGDVGLILFVTLVVATLWQLLGSGPYLYVALAALAAVVVEYTLIGITRPDRGVVNAESPRYLIAAIPLLLVAVAAWYGSRPRPRPINNVPILAILAWAFLMNAMALSWWAERFLVERAHETRAAISVALEYGGSLELPGDRERLADDPFLGSMPGPDRLREIFETIGYLPQGDLEPGTESLPQATYDKIKTTMLADSGASAPDAPD